MTDINIDKIVEQLKEVKDHASFVRAEAGNSVGRIGSHLTQSINIIETLINNLKTLNKGR